MNKGGATGARKQGAGIYIGIAGWAVPKQHAAEFPLEGTHLQRYALRYNAVEINSSFYMPHQPRTYARWAASVPTDFRFSVKVPKDITHTRRLVDAAAPLDRFLGEARELGEKFGPLLVQLPPKLEYDDLIARAFFDLLRSRFSGHVVFEPRHPTWFEPDRLAFLKEYEIARVAADPAPVPEAALPAGLETLRYYRLHGSPDMYYSAYSDEYLDDLTETLARESAAGAETWCIFDNTARQHATVNGLQVIRKLSVPRRFDR